MIATLDDLSGARRWVAWRNERRGDRVTKVPYGAAGYHAKADKSSTWIARADATALAQQLVNGLGGGIGVQLGCLGDGYTLCGVDFDTCLDAKGLVNWAADILAVLDSYAEVSPSGTGLKAFFTIEDAAIRPFLNRLGVPLTGWGCRRGIPGHDSRNHGAAIECYCGFRYFAVTTDRWSGTPATLRLLEATTLDRLADMIPPPGGRVRTRNGNAGGGDTSRSGIAFRKVQEWRRSGAIKTYEDMVAALRADPDTAGWVRDKGEAANQRELHRLWERTAGLPPQFSEDALALRFTEAHPEARYVAPWGRWLFWDGRRWAADTTLSAFDRARAICRAASTQAPARSAVAIDSAKTVAAVVSLARSDRRHAASVEQWDADPWILATPEGIVDLRTGLLGPTDPTCHVTKLTACRPAGDCPLWRGFLERVTAGNVELQDYLARIAGYGLTGSIREHALFFLFGAGANGKGVFINTLSAILGDHAAVAPMDLLLVTQGERHPTELAVLRGARMVSAQETDQGRRWNEAKIKALTGGDPISARFMRQDPFTFSPTFKLIIAGNHKPRLRDVDEANRRRFNLVPFTVTIPTSERDHDLPDKLQVEWPGILRWAIDGCLNWQRIGLAPPAIVRDATENYFGAEDTLAQWIAECCTCAPDCAACTATLYASWKGWTTAAGEFTGSMKLFSQALEKRGFIRGLEVGTRRALFHGLALRLHQEDAG